MKKKWLSFAAGILAIAMLGGCGAQNNREDYLSPSYDGNSEQGSYAPFPGDQYDIMGDESDSPSSPDGDRENDDNFRYDSIVEQGFFKTAEHPSSFFSLDRNTASYSQIRAQIKSDRSVFPDSVRTEEMINYFSYSFPAPQEGELMRATGYLSDCPWNKDHSLMTVGVRTEEKILQTEFNNYVLLVDISGSMSSRVSGLEGLTVLDLVKTGIEKLVSSLTDRDCVSIVTYASGVSVKLEPTFATEAGKKEILHAADSLNSYGATNGSGGLELAYTQAQKHFSDTGNNRVVLMTDGDFNVGIYDKTKLTEFIEEKAKSGIYLSVLGFGMGNMRDDLMQSLALHGNGNYAYIDTPTEAQKVLCEELNGMLVTVAKDAKAGVYFQPEAVKEYRLLGYDMKFMSESDFNNSEKDAGEIGSNLTVVAVFEVELAEGLTQTSSLAEIKIRFKTVSDEQREITESIKNQKTENEDVKFISCVAEFALVLRQSQYKADASLSDVLSRLEEMHAYLHDDIYKSEFEELVKLAEKKASFQ